LNAKYNLQPLRMNKLLLVLIASAVIFNSCKKNSSSGPVVPVSPVTPVNSTDNILNDNAHLVDTLAISGVTATSVSISKSVTTYRPKVGDIILVRPCLQSPYGMLSKVTGVSETPTQVVCTIDPSNLNEAFRQLNIDHSYVDTSFFLTSFRTGPRISISLSDGNTLGNGLKLKGVLTLNILKTTTQYIKKYGSLKPEKIIISADFDTEGSTLEITNPDNSAKVFPGITEVFPLPDIPITIFIGPIPFYFVLAEKVTMNTLALSVSAKGKWTILPKVSFTAGFKYENDVWSSLNTISVDPTAIPLVKGDFSPDLTLTATGTIIEAAYEVTPYHIEALKAFIKASNTLSLTLKPVTPNYSLKYKFDLSGGIKYKFWDGTDGQASLSASLIDRTLLEGNWAPIALSTTVPTTSITQTSAVSGGNITDDGGSAIISRGVCWNASINPTVYNTKTSEGTGTGVFISSLTGLIPDKIYYARAYAINSTDTAYGNEVNFTTAAPTLATVTTTPASAITVTTATAGGNITNYGFAGITARGVCWSTSANPTIANSKTIDGTGTGSFTSSLTGLTANTTYHLRAYATNSAGTAYGNEVSFTTTAATLATINTTGISAITSTTATSGGTITSDGGAPVTSRGVCWSTSADPTIANSKTIDGAGTGNFTSLLTGLTENTTYHIRAYATNNAGTAYGVEFIITTPFAVETVTISGQIWMLKNLDVTTYRNGDLIPQVTDSATWNNLTTGAWRYYNNDPASGAIYGKLYNYYAVSDPRGLAPPGWRIPAHSDFWSLDQNLGGYGISGGKLKSTGTSLWQSPNTDATNSSGFTGLPGGWLINQNGIKFSGQGNYGIWWTTTVDNPSGGIWGFTLSYNNAILDAGGCGRWFGMSVRCIRE
jgi:uncharacterized protein (TIGR02145 family)